MIRTRREGAVLVVTLDRPARRNALTPSALDELAAAVDTDAPVAYLHGAGSAFCAGADLEVVDSLSPAGARAFARRGQRTARALAASPAVVVAGIDGPARGGGVELALACDLVVATPEATFAETGVELGLFGAWGGTVRLPRAVGPAVAADLALSGRVVGAEEARRVGLVSRVTADPRSVAVELAGTDPATLRTVAARLRDDAPVRTRERREARAFGRLVARRNDGDGNGVERVRTDEDATDAALEGEDTADATPEDGDAAAGDGEEDAGDGEGDAGDGEGDAGDGEGDADGG